MCITRSQVGKYFFWGFFVFLVIFLVGFYVGFGVGSRAGGWAGAAYKPACIRTQARTRSGRSRTYAINAVRMRSSSMFSMA